MATDVRETILLKAGSPNLEPEVITARLHEKEKQYRGCHGIFFFLFFFVCIARPQINCDKSQLCCLRTEWPHVAEGREARACTPANGWDDLTVAIGSHLLHLACSNMNRVRVFFAADRQRESKQEY